MGEKCNVLLVHNYYRIPGGEDTVVHNEKAMLEHHGHKVVTYFRRNEEIAAMPLWRKLLLPFTSIFSLRTYRELRRIIREQDIAVVHVHNTLALVSPAVYYAARSCGVPVVQTVHNYRLICPEGTLLRKGRVCEDCVRGSLCCALRHRCYRNSLLQTTVCAVGLWVHRLTGIYRRVHFLFMTDFHRRKMLAADGLFGRPVPTEAHTSLKPHFTAAVPETAPQTRDTYLFVGRLEPRKGVNMLIEAFSRMPQHHLLVVGSGEDEAQYRAAAAAAPHIEFAGYLQKEKLSALMGRVKAVVVTSQCYESFGMMIIEAYAHGVPVIAGRIGGFPQLVQEGETGLLFDYDSADALCEAVKRFESMQGVDWAANTRRAFREHYTEEANYARLTEIYAAAAAELQK